MEMQEKITLFMKRVEWIAEDIPTIAGDAASAVLTVVPVIRDTYPAEALHLLESFSRAFYRGLDEAIKENELEVESELEEM